MEGGEGFIKSAPHVHFLYFFIEPLTYDFSMQSVLCYLEYNAKENKKYVEGGTSGGWGEEVRLHT